MDLKAVGQRIKMAREAKGLTQEDLAAMVELCCWGSSGPLADP